MQATTPAPVPIAIAARSADGAMQVAGLAATTIGLYTPDQRRRRDASAWTLVQAVLAPLQFLVFLVSLVLVLRCLATGQGVFAADCSVLAKTVALYAIMVTGSIWEREVFGVWLFARAFFWEDVFSFVVIALHTAYLALLLRHAGTVELRLSVALAGYAAYCLNAGQFLLKLRAARLDEARTRPDPRAVAARGLPA